MRAGIFLLLIASAVVLSGCIHEEVAPPSAETETQVEQGKEKIMQGSELLIQDLVVGTGEEVRDGDRALVHYTGTFPNGAVFDSSRERKEAFMFTVGKGNVIKGWDLGVKGMKVGGTRRLTVPPQFAYGERGSGTLIPPNATLVFEIELLAINPPEPPSQ